jgi:hypothetical protein
VWEGGVRVNALASGGALPDAVRGTASWALWHLADVHATLCDITGAPRAVCADDRAAAAGLPAPDARSFWPVLNGSLGVADFDALALFDGGFDAPVPARAAGPGFGAAVAAGVGHAAVYDGGSYLVTGEGLKLITIDAADAVWTAPTYPNSSTDWSAQARRARPFLITALAQ